MTVKQYSILDVSRYMSGLLDAQHLLKPLRFCFTFVSNLWQNTLHLYTTKLHLISLMLCVVLIWKTQNRELWTLYFLSSFTQEPLVVLRGSSIFMAWTQASPSHLILVQSEEYSKCILDIKKKMLRLNIHKKIMQSMQ